MSGCIEMVADNRVIGVSPVSRVTVSGPIAVTSPIAITCPITGAVGRSVAIAGRIARASPRLGSADLRSAVVCTN